MCFHLLLPHFRQTLANVCAGVLGCDHVDKMIMDAQNHHQVFRVIIRDTVDPEWMSDVVGGLVAKRQWELIHTVVADW